MMLVIWQSELTIDRYRRVSLLTINIDISLTLGGGMGWLTGEHGMTIDSLLEATVVTGTGKVIRTSGDDDLFWAIQGGGAGSGVVTSMTFKLYKQQRDVFWGVLAMEPEQLPAVIRFVNKFTAGPMNPKSAVYIKLWAKKVRACHPSLTKAICDRPAVLQRKRRGRPKDLPRAHSHAYVQHGLRTDGSHPL
jgi:hypothetical protein